jgi:hypothetical protein
MSALLPHLAELRNAVNAPTNGFIGIVDTILSLCGRHALWLDWRENRCRMRATGSDLEEGIDLPLRQSGFRAVLARVAALCDEQARGKCSPYGGQGDLRDGSRPGVVLHCAWMNTLGEQFLTITSVAAPFEKLTPAPTEIAVPPVSLQASDQ